MQKLIHYGLVGVASNATIYCIYLLITYLGVESKVAVTMQHVILRIALFMLAIISDIHGNHAALIAVLDEIDRMGIENIICLGDSWRVLLLNK